MAERKNRNVGGQVRRDVKEYLIWRITDGCREKKELLYELWTYFAIPRHSAQRILEEMRNDSQVVGVSSNLLDLRQTIFYLPEEEIVLCQI